MSLPTKPQIYRYNSTSIKQKPENAGYYQTGNIYGKSINPQNYITLNIHDNLDSQDITTNNLTNENETEAGLKINNITDEGKNNLNNLQVNNTNNNNAKIQKSLIQKPKQYLSYNNITDNTFPVSDNLRNNITSQDKYLPNINTNNNLGNYPNPFINNQTDNGKVQNVVPIQNIEIINNIKNNNGYINKKKSKRMKKCCRYFIIALKCLTVILTFALLVLICAFLLKDIPSSGSGGGGGGEINDYHYTSDNDYDRRRKGYRSDCFCCCCSKICKWIFKEEHCCDCFD